MPALRLLGRKWLAASDDLVFPSIFELLFRFVCLVFTALVTRTQFPLSWDCQHGGLVRVYLAGTLALQCAVLLLLAALATQSARGTIVDTHARRLVAPLLLVKILLLVPEVCLNVVGTIWIFFEVAKCSVQDKFSSIVIQCLVVSDWAYFALFLLVVLLVFDPLGSVTQSDLLSAPDTRRHKVSTLWSHTFYLAFGWVKGDKKGTEAFKEVAALLSVLFRCEDLVLSDVVAGCVLLQVRQAREASVQSADDQHYTADIEQVFSEVPGWMNLSDALHYLKLSTATYSWPYVLYRHWLTGLCRLAAHTTCCCCRPPETTVMDDNCCYCYLAGVRYLSGSSPDDILYASFNNHLFEVAFCVMLDRARESVVVAIRGSIALRDFFTDVAGIPEPFDAPGLPPGTQAHKGMLLGATSLQQKLAPVLEEAFANHPRYNLVVTGHSLGAGVAVLLGIKLKPQYPDLKVFAFSPPAGLISRGAARYTEEFVLTVGLGDDIVMRLSLHSVDKLRTRIVQCIDATKLPKYRIKLKGLAYAARGVPTRDHDSVWRAALPPEDCESGGSVRVDSAAPVTPEAVQIYRDAIASEEMYMPGRVLHIVRPNRPSGRDARSEPRFLLGWARPEHFSQVLVTPRMLLDHTPDNLLAAANAVLQAQQSHSSYARLS